MAVLVYVVATVSVESRARGPRAGGMLVLDHAWVQHSCWCTREDCGYSPRHGRSGPFECKTVHAQAPRRSLEYPGYRTYASMEVLQVLRRAQSA